MARLLTILIWLFLHIDHSAASFPKMRWPSGVGCSEGLVLIDPHRNTYWAQDLRGQSTLLKYEIGNITLLLYNLDLNSFCQGNCMLPLETMISASSFKYNYLRVSQNDRLVCNVQFQWLPEDIRQSFEIEPELYIFLINLVVIHQENGCLWTNGVTYKKRFVYLIETGFSLMSPDQPL